MIFFHMVGFHLKNMFRRREFYFALLASVVLLLVTAFGNLAALFRSDVLELCPAWMYFGFTFVSTAPYLKMILQMFMMLLLPFVASLAYSYSCFDDYQTGVSKILFSRVKRSIYYNSAAFVSFLGAFLILFLPLALRELVFGIAVPLHSLVLTPGYPTGDLVFRNVNFWRSLCLNHPYAYFFIYTLIPALAGGLIGLLSFSISLYYKKNRFLILTLPGIFYIVFNFVCALTGHTGVSPSYLILPPYDVKGIELMPLVIEILILILINLAALIGKVRFKRDEL